jgi:uncharacterized RDD family membrane protein YckC
MQKEISTKLRLWTMLLDHILLCFSLIPLLIIVQNIAGRESNATKAGMILILAIYLCKDCIQGRSPAKRILKLRVISLKDGAAATSLQCLIRNLPLVIWPVEVIIAINNKEQRLGDKLAKTKLVYDEEKDRQPVRIGDVLLSLLLAAVFCAAISMLF